MDGQVANNQGKTFIDALHALDQNHDGAVEAMVALFAADAVLTNAALALAGEQRQGQEGVRQFWTEYRQTFREAETHFSHVMTDERAVGLFWTTNGTDSTGEPMNYEGVSLLEYNDAGKIVAFKGYYDTRQLSRTVNAPER